MKTYQIEEYLEKKEFNAEIIEQNCCPDLREYLDTAINRGVLRGQILSRS